MEIRHLATFLKIIETGSYTAAAAELGYTQSTITSHMQTLEQSVGGEVFTYFNRKLQLTALGKELIPLAEDLLATHDKIKNMQKTDGLRGTLRVAAPESLTISRLGPVIKRFSQHHPDVKLILTNGTCGENQEELLNGRVDVALMLFPAMAVEKCLHHVLTEEKIVMVGAPDAPEQFKDIQKKQSDHVYITNEQGCSYRTMFEQHLTKQNLLSFQTMELWSIGAIKKMVMSGLGFAVLPYITVQEELENGSLKIIKQDEAFEPIYSHILIKKKKWVSPIAHAFMEAVIDSIPSTSLRPVPLAE